MVARDGNSTIRQWQDRNRHSWSENSQRKRKQKRNTSGNKTTSNTKTIPLLSVQPSPCHDPFYSSTTADAVIIFAIVHSCFVTVSPSPSSARSLGFVNRRLNSFTVVSIIVRPFFRLRSTVFILFHLKPSVRSSVRSFVRSSVRSLVRSFVRSSVRPFVRPSVRPFVRSSVRLFVRSLTKVW